MVDGRFVAAKPFEQDKYPSKMIAGLPDHVHNAARIRYPMVRVDWMRKGHQSDTSQRGDNRFVRVSWDEALDLFYQELERVQTTYGPSALLTASGWQSTGMFHNASGMLARAIALHGNSVSTGGGLFDRRGAGDSAARGGFNGSVRTANFMASCFTEQ
ncbi:trimethylamine-N-oxide reductase [Salmonella enterica subsp. arizonae]|uniref:Trimethylamine-N-oxide reductase n=1 Tax=Salmonella enterica subsp. arizonae TaxID=59203 RepID=A0A3S4HBD1_SALER|nr:trimethylamine-N-oxide reductase [Salmonella enterica subsp. arizonae]